MELDDLLREEGLDAAGVEDALAWARRRAAELVRDVDGDPELGPLLDGARVVVATEVERPAEVEPPAAAAPSPARRQTAKTQPLFSDLRGLQAAFLAEADEEEDELPEVGAVLRAFQKGRSGPARAGVPAVVATPPSDREDASPEADREAATAATGDGDAVPAATSAPDHAREAAVEAEPDAPRSFRRKPPRVTADESTEADVDGHHATVDGGEAPVASLPQDSVLSPEGSERGDGDASASDEVPAPDHGVPAPPEADLDPLAGIDFDDLPGVDEDDEEEDHTHVDLPSPTSMTAAAERELESRTTMIPMDGPDLTLPSMQAPLAELIRARAEGALPGEPTERFLDPLLPAEPTGEVTVTAMAPSPFGAATPETTVTSDVTAPAPVDAAPEEEPAEEAEEIELLDDEDLLLVEEEEPEDEDEEVPEWKRALLESAQIEQAQAARRGADEPGDD